MNLSSPLYLGYVSVSLLTTHLGTMLHDCAYLLPCFPILALPGFLLSMAAPHFVEGTQAPEKPGARQPAKIVEPVVRGEAGPLRRWEIGNANLEMKGVGL